MKFKANEIHTTTNNRILRRIRPKVDVRATIGFAPETYQNLQNIAFTKRVSIGHVVREAVESYLTSTKSQAPLEERSQ